MMTTLLIAAAGMLSAALYLRRRRWVDALLVLMAAAGLAGLVGKFSLPANPAGSVSIASDRPPPAIGNAAVVKLDGDGLRAAQWHDLPARQLAWKAPSLDTLRLEFPAIASPARMFRLTATTGTSAPRRLQLLAENGKVIAEAAGSGTTLTVQWLPPVAETLVLKARLLDAAGIVIAQGPVPVEIRATAPMQVRGRLGSPSFDANALNALLASGSAIIDWQVNLGKTVTRSETPRAAIERPDLLVMDAAYVEGLAAAARASLLAQVDGGATLLVLGANTRDAQFWSRTVQLPLKAQPESAPSGVPLALLSAPYNPPPQPGGQWSPAGDRIWSRPWQQGRIVWVGVSGWHRYAIGEPQALGVWWQDVLDRAGLVRDEQVALTSPEDLPLPGQRLEVCAHGVSGAVAVPALKQVLTWQRRSDRPDAACVAVWPQASGWLTMTSAGQSLQMYVYANDDWPLWQKTQRRDATARYAVRTRGILGTDTTALPGWPFALLFATASLLLWWRERR
jgi:hypothetical protein